MNNKLFTLRRQQQLPEALYNKLHNSGGCTPCLYDLHKIHKNGVLLHPIVLLIHSPTNQLSKYLSTLLSYLVGR